MFSLPSFISPGRAYAGIGSRRTPPEILELMTKLARKLDAAAMILRSGGAQGADSAFAAGATHREIFIPWRSFSDDPHAIPIDRSPFLSEALREAQRLHPFWEKCSRGARLLHARNIQQVQGLDLKHASAFVLCWTPNASGEGGTGQAIRNARELAIPVFDLGDPQILRHVRAWLDGTLVPSEAPIGATPHPAKAADPAARYGF